MSNEGNLLIKTKSAMQLRKIVDETIGKNVTTSAMWSDDDKEHTRLASDMERNVIFDLVYGAIMSVRHNGADVTAAANTAEFIACRMLPHIQTYLCVYMPIVKICKMKGDENE